MFHVNKKGVKGKCGAKSKESCPYYDDKDQNGGHFGTEEEIEEYVSNKFSQPELSKGLYSYNVNIGEKGAREPQTMTEAFSRPEPNFSYSTFSFGEPFTLDSGAKLESKNKGEYSEMAALVSVLSEKSVHVSTFSPNKWEPSSVSIGNMEYIIRQDEEDPDDPDYKPKPMVFCRPVDSDPSTPGKRVLSADDTETSSYLIDAIKSGSSTARTFGSPSIQRACVAFGFTDGRVPKAPSSSKADMVVWDKEGKEHRVSVKSYLGSDPALTSPSKSSAVRWETRSPLSKEETKGLVEELNNSTNLTPSDKFKILKKRGILFSADEGSPVSKSFKENMNNLGEGPRKAYSKALFNIVDSSTGYPDSDPNLKKDWNTTLDAFSRGMTYTDMETKDKWVTDFMTISQDGKTRVHNFSNEQECGEYMAKRIRVQPSGSKTGSPMELSVSENGIVKMKLNGGLSLSLNEINRRQ